MEWKTVEKKGRGRTPQFMKKIWPPLRREEALRYLEKEKFSESPIRWSEMTDEEKELHLRKAEAWLDDDRHFLNACWEKYKSTAKKV